MTSPKIEYQLISEIFCEPKIFDDVKQLINLSVFTDGKCKAIYSAFCEIEDSGKNIDNISVCENLKNRGLFDIVSIAEVAKLSTLASSAANFSDHCKFLIEKWMQRGLITKMENAREKIKLGEDIFEVISSLSEDIYQIENNVIIEKDKDIYSELPALLSEVEQKYLGNIPEGLKSDSFPTLNRATGGIMSSDFVVVYGTEKSAKTTYTDRLALDFAFQGVPVAIFTLEMDFKSSAYKALSMEGGLEYLKLRNPKGQQMIDSEFVDFIEKTKKFKNTKIFIDDKTFDFDRIIGKMKIMKRKHNIGLFVIDYLGLIEVSKRFEARRLEIKYYSRRLKNLCKELNTPIIAVSQANDKEKTAESVDPLRDCDFALRCCKPLEDGNASIKIDEGDNYCFTKDDFLITVERSRHGKNKQNFVCSYFGTNFREKDLFHKEEAFI